MRTIKSDNLRVRIFKNRADMGVAAAAQAIEAINSLLEKKDEINIVFAAAPSQNDFLAELSKAPIDWDRINAYHMDEYIGLPEDAPQGFGNFLRDRIFGLVPFKSVHYLYNKEKSPEQVCKDYQAMLDAITIDIIFMGIGENGHIAFNDPPVADFNDPLGVKIVELDHTCRMQQVHDGCFASLDEVPTHAISLSCSMMMRGEKLIAVVPTTHKAKAIKATIYGPISTECPASIMRTHKDVTLYTDEDGASLL